MNPLNQIVITGYKSIRSLERLFLKNINVLIGANGAGKSNLLSFFKLVNAIANQRMQNFVSKEGGSDALLHFGSKNTDEILGGLYFGDLWYRFRLNTDSLDDFYLNESISGDKNFVFGTSLESQLSNTSINQDDIIKEIINTLKVWEVYHFQDMTNTAKIKKKGDLNHNDRLYSDGSNLAAYLYLIEKKYPVEYRRIEDAIRMVAPFFNGFSLRPDPLNENKIRLEWKHKNSDAPWLANYLSDGTLRFMCLATLLFQPIPPSLIIIDEPELGLHPYAIGILAEMIKSASAKTQVLVSTQSAALVNYFEPGDVIVVNRKNGASTFERLDQKDLETWLDEYSIGELWERNIFPGGARK